MSELRLRPGAMAAVAIGNYVHKVTYRSPRPRRACPTRRRCYGPGRRFVTTLIGALFQLVVCRRTHSTNSVLASV